MLGRGINSKPAFVSSCRNAPEHIGFLSTRGSGVLKACVMDGCIPLYDHNKETEGYLFHFINVPLNTHHPINTCGASEAW